MITRLNHHALKQSVAYAAFAWLSAWTTCDAGTWVPTSAGPHDFNTASNWSSPAAVPNAAGDVANMQSTNITAAQTVNLSSSVTIGSLKIGDSSTSSGSVFGYTLAPTTSESIMFDVTAGNATISKPSRTNAVPDAINVPISISTGDTLVVTNSASSSALLTLGGAITGDSTTTLSFGNAGGQNIVTGDLSGFNGTFSMTTGNTTVGGANFSSSLHTTNGQNAAFTLASAGPGGGTNLAQAASRYFRFGLNDGSGGSSLLKLGALSGNGWINPQTGGSPNAYTSTNYEVGALGLDTTFGGTIIRRASSTFTKVGTGSLTLSGPNYYDGTTVVSAGTLVAGANVSASTLVQTALSMPAGSNLSLVNHGLVAGDRVTFSGTVGAGMTTTTNYVVHTVVDADTFTVALATSPGTQITTTTAASSLTVTQQSAFGAGNVALQLGDGNTGANNVSLLIGGAFTVERGVDVTSNGSGTATLGGNTNDSSFFTGAVSLSKDMILTSNALAANAVNITGGISSTGVYGITKVGSGNAILSGVNSYTGDTTVSQGMLSITDDYLADAAAVWLATGSAFDLSFVGIDTIAALYFDAVSQAPGTWGAIGSGANHESSLITGSGMLFVVPEPGVLALLLLASLGAVRRRRRIAW